ncbi:hypothetical protein [Streptomyces sp. NPDC006638]|uniref:hypothetical protein n=1 Tax=Streptomyces sp. NPDC006638 TaxID=3157183 RepID=UPI0033A23C3E
MADVEMVLTSWIRETLSVETSVDRPPELETVLPWITVVRVGGASQRFTGHPRVDVDVYADTADEAARLAGVLDDALLFLRGPVAGAVIRGVTCESGPSKRPELNPAVHRLGASYRVSLRAA